ncbi:hypothetical protein M6B38_239375 [Iris pallida]|uniref:Uncharacterized protein n=1 Tax=Iris pallida TaxID=29817 RepID=A0AAX6DL33_IRIPA|nr:hypothetical protein M6B38_239375 [Iris pallida]
MNLSLFPCRSGISVWSTNYFFHWTIQFSCVLFRKIHMFVNRRFGCSFSSNFVHSDDIFDLNSCFQFFSCSHVHFNFLAEGGVCYLFNF